MNNEQQARRAEPPGQRPPLSEKEKSSLWLNEGDFSRRPEDGIRGNIDIDEGVGCHRHDTTNCHEETIAQAAFSIKCQWHTS